MQTKFRRVFNIMMLFIAITIGIGGVMPAQPALAGSNGQQIFFSCSTPVSYVAMMDYAVVKGYNQYGNYVMWQGPARWGTGYTYIFTNGWWWIGNVRIYWWNGRTNTWKSTVAYVPKEQSGNISYFSCPISLW